MTRRFVATARPLATVAVSVLAVGCALGGSAPPESETTGDVVLTNRGARATFRGDAESVAGSVEEVFRVLDIDLNRRSVDDRGGIIEGQAGTDRVFVEMSAAGSNRTEVSVRVRTPSGGPWDRGAARGILLEIRRWQAS